MKTLYCWTTANSWQQRKGRFMRVFAKCAFASELYRALCAGYKPYFWCNKAYWPCSFQRSLSIKKPKHFAMDRDNVSLYAEFNIWDCREMFFHTKLNNRWCSSFSQTKACRRGSRVQTVESSPRRCYSRALAKTYTLDSCSCFAIESPIVLWISVTSETLTMV